MVWTHILEVRILKKNTIFKIFVIVLLVSMCIQIQVLAATGDVAIRNVIKDTEVYTRDGTVVYHLKKGTNNIEVTENGEFIDAIGKPCRQIIGEVTTAEGDVISGDTGEYFVYSGDLRNSEAEGTYDPDEDEDSEGSGGYGTTGTYGTGEVVIETDSSSGKGGGGLADMTQTDTLDDYKSLGVEGAASLSARTNIMVGIIQAVGTVVAVIMLTIIAIKYMVSSVEERADYKQTMVPFIIGAGSLLIISNLVGIIYSIIENINV